MKGLTSTETIRLIWGGEDTERVKESEAGLKKRRDSCKDEEVD